MSKGKIRNYFFIPKFLTKNPNIALIFMLTTTSKNSLLTIL